MVDCKSISLIHNNPRISMLGIPLEAKEYVVNGHPELDWVVEGQCVKTDRQTVIVELLRGHTSRAQYF